MLISVGMNVLWSFLSTLRSGLRSRASMQMEILALRHQLAVLQRRTNKRASLRTADRWLWVILSRPWIQWRSAPIFVKPENGVFRQRKGFYMYWRCETGGGENG